MGLMTDIWGWIILFLGLLFWFTFFMLVKNNITYEIKGESTHIIANNQLLTLLRTPVNEGNVASLIAAAYETGETTQLTLELNSLFNSIYDKHVCWKLWYYEDDDKEILAEEDCQKKKQLFDAKATIPLHNSEILDIRLNVLGYKE